MKRGTRNRITRGILSGAMLLISFGVSGFAQDRITVQSGSGLKHYEGTVRSFTGKEGLVLRIRDGSEEIFSIDCIREIRTKRNESHVQADSHFERNRFEDALNLYRKARELENRPWVRQQISTMCVRSLRALDRTGESYQEFLNLTRTDPFSPYFTCIPLMWFSGSSLSSVGISPEQRFALQWIELRNNPDGIENHTISLLAASILLSSPRNEHRVRAVEQLRKLTYLGTNPSVSDNPSKPESDHEALVRNQLALLANAQLWRTKIVNLKSKKDLESWEPLVDSMFEPLRGGPYLILGEGYAKIQDHEKAVLCWMRIPILHEEDRNLSAKALLESARTLRRLGREEQMKTLLQEILRDYSDRKPFAEDAALELKRK